MADFSELMQGIVDYIESTGPYDLAATPQIILDPLFRPWTEEEGMEQLPEFGLYVRPTDAVVRMVSRSDIEWTYTVTVMSILQSMSLIDLTFGMFEKLQEALYGVDFGDFKFDTFDKRHSFVELSPLIKDVAVSVMRIDYTLTVRL